MNKVLSFYVLFSINVFGCLAIGSFRPNEQKSKYLIDLQNDTSRCRYKGYDFKLDVWTVDGKSYHGNLTCFVYKIEYSKKKDKVSTSYHYRSQIFDLDTSVSVNVFDLLSEISTFLKLKNNEKSYWSCTGFNHIFNYITPRDSQKFIVQSYYLQDEENPYINDINKRLDSIKILVKQKEKDDSFWNKLESGNYTINHALVTTKHKMSNKERKWRKEHKNDLLYIDSIENVWKLRLADTLKVYLDSIIDLREEGQFVVSLIFDTTNSLKSIYSYNKFYQNESRRANKRQHKRLKASVKKAVKRMDLSEFHSKINYQIRINIRIDKNQNLTVRL